MGLFLSGFLNLLDSLLQQFSSCMSFADSQSGGSINGTDRLALLAIKARITNDPFHVVSSWNDSIPYCEWPGIICGDCRHPSRVKALRLQPSGLVGSIALEIGNLSFLQEISLYNNSFHDEIPREVSFLFKRHYLLLNNNSFEGEISPNISRCSNLIELILGFNKIVGKIPVKLGQVPTDGVFQNLSAISVIGNNKLCGATDEFSSTNLIGVRSFGSVYKGVLNHGETIVAVKVLNIRQRGASKSFLVECESLRNIRHRNLVRILTSWSSIDFEGNQFKALVYEFMPSGNLESWLHPHANSIQDEQRHLNLVQRLNIAIDMATTLDYFRHHCHTQIIHCDLNPSNILLDGNLTAHLGDCGISRILLASTNRSQNHTSSIEIKGSIGYIAPEYGAGVDVSTHGDVYNYGILLLDMFTRKRPTHEMFKDNFNLHYWAKMVLNDGVMAIVDPSLLSIEEDENEATTIVTTSLKVEHA
ncbi:probable LRR receptor-like serine/threonine-protein kinase At3g47570 [Macadamia integrifolia]|uniref:probable LRR receptor-like serine/threonine-protein kinase At3g47570 n=1 Tax=Macadamia integrifolia TaxID=60698 RepID=UPI001C4E89A0|nr:probable LRR receptor-like serine/threonine-protein kinase At3g47570 [Macadamia integrifolia]